MINNPPQLNPHNDEYNRRTYKTLITTENIPIKNNNIYPGTHEKNKLLVSGQLNHKIQEPNLKKMEIKDREFFSQYLQSFEMVFATQMGDCVFIKDIDFNYQMATDKIVQLFGIDSTQDMLGKSITEIAKNNSLYSPELIKQWTLQDKQIQTDKKRRVYLDIVSCNGNNQISLQYKTPIVNPETNNFVGIRGLITNLVWPHAVKTLFKMHGTKGLLIGHKMGKENLLESYPLSSIQHMVLFLALNNYSYSEIALLLNEFGYQITPIRVNDYLEQLKLIFHVRNKTQLIEKSIGLNFHTLLPEGLFNKFSSTEVSNDEAKIISIYN